MNAHTTAPGRLVGTTGSSNQQDGRVPVGGPIVTRLQPKTASRRGHRKEEEEARACATQQFVVQQAANQHNWGTQAATATRHRAHELSGASYQAGKNRRSQENRRGAEKQTMQGR